MKLHWFLKSVIFAAALSFLVGCTGGPSVCDKREEAESYLCETAEKAGIRLEDAGNILMIANAVAIGEGAYSRGDALKVLVDIRSLINSSPSYSFITKAVRDKVDRYPGLFIVAEVYLSSMNQPQIISNFDRDILDSWLGRQIAILGD